MVCNQGIHAVKRCACSASDISSTGIKPKGSRDHLRGGPKRVTGGVCNERKKDMETAQADHGLEDVTRYLTLRQRCRG